MTRKDVQTAVYACETIASALDAIQPALDDSGSRGDLNKTAVIHRMLARLTNTELAELDRKNRFGIAPDSYVSSATAAPALLCPTSQAGLRTNPDDPMRRKRGGGYDEDSIVDTTVARRVLPLPPALLQRAADAVTRDRLARYEMERRDYVGHAIASIFGCLTDIAALAATLGTDWPDARPTLNLMFAKAKTVTRAHDFVEHVKTKAAGRQSALAGVCLCCSRVVYGTADDPMLGTKEDKLRAGYCNECRMAWKRAGCPDRAMWERTRREELGSEENLAS